MNGAISKPSFPGGLPNERYGDTGPNPDPDDTMSDVMASPPPTKKASGLPFSIPANRWDDAVAAEMSSEQLLLYRSNLLGSDLTVTNFGGGNTSGKLEGVDPLTGAWTKVLWVKGSGGDIGSMKLEGFATLYLDKLRALEDLYRRGKSEDDMVGYLPHCTFNLNPRAASIDTPLHGFLPFEHVDHVHPDAVTALAASSEGQRVAREIWGDRVGWLDWKRPGFELGLRLRDYVAGHTGMLGVILAGHGLICWGDDSRACYDNTVRLIAEAAHYLNERLARSPAFGGARSAPLPREQRKQFVARAMPRLRGLLSTGRNKVGDFSDDPETLEFVCSKDMERLAQIGTSCPDHFLRTKIRPMTLDPDRINDTSYVTACIDSYKKEYAAYYQRCAAAGDPPMRDPNPVVVLIPGVGRMTFAADKTTARLAGEFYRNAINVMRGAEAIGQYEGLDEKEAYGIEYWVLEEAKLKRLPPPKALVGKIALVTGAAGGIGLATVRRLLGDGACVMLVDRDAENLEKVVATLTSAFGRDFVRATTCDVTNEAEMTAAFDTCAREFGGLDILVANAGLASSAPVEATTMETWRLNYGVLVEGSFLAARAAFPLMKMQGRGSLVFIGSKNALAATPNASAYASAKAAVVHLARCLALEGAEHGIRVNVVNPDAVIRGSKIWSGEWRKERADAYGIGAGDELEEYYRKRSMLKQSVLPEDIAEAVWFFASDATGKSTGNIINVDAGNAQAFTR